MPGQPYFTDMEAAMAEMHACCKSMGRIHSAGKIKKHSVNCAFDQV